jgi:hypothetical protein
MEINIVNFAEQEGQKIANAILAKHAEYPHVVGKTENKGMFGDFKKGFSEARETKKIEQEISDRVLHEATAFFLKNSDIKFDSEVSNALIGHLSQKAKNPSVLKKLSPEQLLASEIQNFATDFLLKNDVFVFENNV